MVDVGARRDAFCKHLVRFYKTYCYAVEADPNLYHSIEETRRVKKFNIAISDAEGPIRLAVSVSPTADSSPADLLAARNPVIVHGMPFETFIRFANISSVDLLKIGAGRTAVKLFHSAGDDRIRGIPQITVRFPSPKEAPGFARKIRRIITRLQSLGFLYFVFPKRSSLSIFYLSIAGILNTRRGPGFGSGSSRWFAEYGSGKAFISLLGIGSGLWYDES
ncbi:MAG: FkbM family methyltransferase [Candidatus Omnitrophica bacterium]|nr:FkbM family methyltransferase [Candidatus Omnitrophota bacterium]